MCPGGDPDTRPAGGHRVVLHTAGAGTCCVSSNLKCTVLRQKSSLWPEDVFMIKPRLAPTLCRFGREKLSDLQIRIYRIRVSERTIGLQFIVYTGNISYCAVFIDHTYFTETQQKTQ